MDLLCVLSSLPSLFLIPTRDSNLLHFFGFSHLASLTKPSTGTHMSGTCPGCYSGTHGAGHLPLQTLLLDAKLVILALLVLVPLSLLPCFNFLFSFPSSSARRPVAMGIQSDLHCLLAMGIQSDLLLSPRFHCY